MVAATTDADIARQIAEDPDTAAEFTRDEMRAARRVVPPKTVDVGAVRAKLELSERQFAESYGFSLRTLQKWEQGTRTPDQSVRLLLAIIDENPDYVALLASRVSGKAGA